MYLQESMMSSLYLNQTLLFVLLLSIDILLLHISIHKPQKSKNPKTKGQNQTEKERGSYLGNILARWVIEDSGRKDIEAVREERDKPRIGAERSGGERNANERNRSLR